MNKRERVLAAIGHQETDFVPYNLHAVPTVWQRVCEVYDLPDPHAAASFVGNHIVKIGSDFNYNPWAEDVGKVQLTLSGGPVQTAMDAAGGLHTDEFGCVWDRAAGLPHPVSYPLGDVEGGAALAHALENFKMPDPRRAGRFDQAGQLADRYRGDLFLFGKLGMVLFERAWSIRGMQQLFVDMATEPQFVEDLLDRIVHEWNLPIVDQQLALGVDGFYFSDDWGSTTQLMFSRKMWQRFIKPRLALIYDHCHAAGVVVGQHSDGAISPLFPDLIEIGLDVFNPLSPHIMDPAAMKQQYGDKLCFYGGIDVEDTLPFGTPDDVRAEIRSRAEVMSVGGGYILQSSHTILDDTPVENLMAYIDEVRAMAGMA